MWELFSECEEIVSRIDSTQRHLKYWESLRVSHPPEMINVPVQQLENQNLFYQNQLSRWKAACSIQKAYKDWKWRRDVVWNPYTAIGHLNLKIRANTMERC